MNSEGYRRVAASAGYKGSERLVLALLAMCAEEGEAAGVDRLASDSGMCPKQILRITSKLKARGAIEVRGGSGPSPYTFTLASANEDKMSPQDEAAEVSCQDIKSPPADSQDILSSLRADKMSSLADAGTKCPDYDCGTGVAPYVAETTSTDKNKNPNTTTRKRVVSAATRLPEDFAVTPALREWALKEAADVDLDAATEEFRDYWRGVPGARGTKLDWPATWRNRMREMQQRIIRNGGRHAGSQGRVRTSGNGQQPKPSLADRAREHAEHFGVGGPARRAG